MNDSTPWLETDVALRRFVAGWLILVVTVVLSNAFGFLDHPDRLFDVLPSSSSLERTHAAGYLGQLLFGCWLGLALILEIRLGRRACLALWLVSLAAFFAPMPAATSDPWLAPLLLVLALTVGLISRAVDAALLEHAA